MDISQLWEAWPITGPWHLSPLSGGTNNSILRADAADGNSYVLRLIADSSHIPHILYEAPLLEALSNKQPPFQLPLPLRTHQGGIVVPFQQKAGTIAFAVLSHLLPGVLPDRDDIAIASHAGSTLAWLDHALATLPTTNLPKENQLLPTFGKLTRLHHLYQNLFLLSNSFRLRGSVQSKYSVFLQVRWKKLMIYTLNFLSSCYIVTMTQETFL